MGHFEDPESQRWLDAQVQQIALCKVTIRKINDKRADLLQDVFRQARRNGAGTHTAMAELRRANEKATEIADNMYSASKTRKKT
jgi:hypothetical protein